LNATADAVDFAGIRRALVIKLRHHGDVLLASPVISALKRHAPHIEIDALVYADTAEMLTGHPDLAQLHLVDRGWKKAGLARRAASEWGLWRALKARRPDLIVHLDTQKRGMWLARWLRPAHAVAPRAKRDDAMWKESFSHLYARPPRGNSRHTVETNLDALRRIGIFPGEAGRGLTLLPGAAAEGRIDEVMAAQGLAPREFILLHPASRWMFKTWPAERTAQLIDKLSAQGLRIVLTCAPSAGELALLVAVKSHLAPATPAPTDLGGQLSLKELAALAARARVFVGVDSAPMHIAAAVGTPVVALFGPSGDIEWGPWNVAHRVVASTHHPCRPCGNDGCGGSKVSDCLVTLPVARVFDAVLSLINETS
jgi:heptosyltransferase-3